MFNRTAFFALGALSTHLLHTKSKLATPETPTDETPISQTEWTAIGTVHKVTPKEIVIVEKHNLYFDRDDKLTNPEATFSISPDRLDKTKIELLVKAKASQEPVEVAYLPTTRWSGLFGYGIATDAKLTRDIQESKSCQRK